MALPSKREKKKKRLDLTSCVSAQPCEDLASVRCTLTRGLLLHCGKKITPVSTMMPVFSVNLSWQHPALTPVTRRGNRTFPLRSSSPSSHWLVFWERNGASAPRAHRLAQAPHKEKQPWSWQLCMQTQYAPLVCCLISFSLSVPPACSLRPETAFSSQSLKAARAGRTQ